MLNRAVRTISVSLFALGALVAFAPASVAQETTTTVAAAPVADTAAPVADTVAPAADTVAPAADTVAPAPEGAVAAGGGFLSQDSDNTLPIVLGAGALLAGAGFVVSRRRKA